MEIIIDGSCISSSKVKLHVFGYKAKINIFIVLAAFDIHYKLYII